MRKHSVLHMCRRSTESCLQVLKKMIFSFDLLFQQLHCDIRSCYSISMFAFSFIDINGGS
jgi:hypothetical protein